MAPASSFAGVAGKIATPNWQLERANPGIFTTAPLCTLPQQLRPHPRGRGPAPGANQPGPALTLPHNRPASLHTHGS